MTEEQQLKEENKALKDAMANLMPDVGKLNDMFATLKGTMGVDVSEIEKVTKSLQGAHTQFSKMAEFLNSPEAKKAMKTFTKK
jgi:DNA anti-recombination protein RmuC